MYYPLLFNKESELVACDNHFDSVKRTCNPVVAVKVSSKSKATKTKSKNNLFRWAEISQRSGCITLNVGPSQAEFIASMDRLPLGSNLRLGVDAADFQHLLPDCRAFHERFGRGAMLRVESEQLKRPGVAKRLSGFQTKIPLLLMIKLRSLNGRSALEAEDHAKAVLSIAYDVGFSDVIINGGSFPADHTGMGNRNVTRVERVESELFRRLHKEFPGLHFSDLGPHGEAPPKGDLRLTKYSPAVRYAIHDAWMVHRGNSVELDQFETEFISVCNSIVQASYFDRGFSWADDQLEMIASRSTIPPSKPGNAKAIDVNRHLAFVSDEVDRLDGPPTLHAVHSGAV